MAGTAKFNPLSAPGPGASQVPGLPPAEELLAGLDYSPTAAPPRLALDRLAGPDSLRALGLPLGAQSAPSFLGSAEAQSWPAPGAEEPPLPPGWERTIRAALKKRLAADRNLRLHLEGCQRCGACADKCHLYLGSGDPLQMPLLRAELLRAFYRGEFTLAGRLLGLARLAPLDSIAGLRRLDRNLLGQWFHYFHQCSLCRRCAVYCPLGLDNSAISALGRDLLLELGLGREGVLAPLRRTLRCGNHAGLTPDALKRELESLCDHIERLTGLRLAVPLNESGREVLFVPAASDFLSALGRRNLAGCLMLLHEAGLDYTISTYASGAENYGAFAGPALRGAVGRRMYAEAARLGCKWILAGDDGQMWRVLQQYLGAGSGQSLAEEYGLETPRNPATGTLFSRASACAALHLDELAADLLAKRKIRLKPRRNREYTVTFHDSCQAARSLGMLEEPRRVLAAACAAFAEMPPETIRERTYCCGAGGGLNADLAVCTPVAESDGEKQAAAISREPGALREIRLRGGLPRGLALRRVQRENGVNLLASSCATCRSALPDLADYWAPGVEVAGLYEILGNALVLRGEKKRLFSLSGRPLPGVSAALLQKEAGEAAVLPGALSGDLPGAEPEEGGTMAAPAILEPGGTGAVDGFLDQAALDELSRLAALADALSGPASDSTSGPMPGSMPGPTTGGGPEGEKP